MMIIATQLVCFGCASLLDEATDQQVSGGNTDLVLAALGWMCENDAPVIDVTSKSLTMSYLTVPQFDAAYWSIIVCGVIPVVFLLIGTVIWLRGETVMKKKRGLFVILAGVVLCVS